MVRSDHIRLIDDFLPVDEHARMWEFLSGAAWEFGAYSDGSPGGSRYFFKHFAGYVQSGSEARTGEGVERELMGQPLLFSMWERLKAGPLRGRPLARCYANGMPPGAEGGLHFDSDVDTHFTAIYYPHPRWHPNLGGETLFFNPDASDLIGAVYPKPNRLVIFPGTVPHVARPLSVKSRDLRITLMFKTGPA